jgi:Flp pilus assembly protein TadG
MPRPASICRRFIASTRGLAAVEFAMILPVLVTMFLASFDGGRALAVYMKVRAATYALASITNQYTTIQSTDMTSIVGATSVVLAPYSSSPIVVTISQITISSKGVATVSWSYSLNGTARTQGSSITLPTALDTDSTYLIFAEVKYIYTPMFGYFGSGAITLSDNLYVTPRSSNCINYPPENVTSCS